jgi:hypothetical protein
LALTATCASQRVETLADFHRGFNALWGTSVTYKAFYNLNVARKPRQSFGLVKKQWVTGAIQSRNRYPLRQNTLHLPAAYPRIDLASLIQMDPQRFRITGRLSLVYDR